MAELNYRFVSSIISKAKSIKITKTKIIFSKIKEAESLE